MARHIALQSGYSLKPIIDPLLYNLNFIFLLIQIGGVEWLNWTSQGGFKYHGAGALRVVVYFGHGIAYSGTGSQYDDYSS